MLYRVFHLDVIFITIVLLLVPCTECFAQIAALHLTIWVSYGVKIAHWVFGFLEPFGFMTCYIMSFPPGCKSQSYSIIIIAKHLMSCTNYSITSQYFA